MAAERKKDYYESLGVSRGATPDELKDAYRRLAKQYHPDINNKAGAEERFKEINEAYGVLSDEQRRAAYDRFGHAGLDGMSMDFDFGFGDIFEEFFGFGTGRRRSSPRRGADLRFDLPLEFEEAVFGAEKEIEFERRDTCTRCEGSGAEPGTVPIRCATCDGAGQVRQVRQTFLGSMVNVTTCPECGGRGEVVSSPCSQCRGNGIERRGFKQTVSVPPGVDEGTQIRLSGQGEPGANGGRRGNLYVIPHIRPHKFFRRRKDDILIDLSINLAQATLGATIQVPALDGDEQLNIPPGTQPGKVFRLRGKGVPRLRRNGRGDQLVIVSVDVPKSLSEEQRLLFEQLADTLGTEVKPRQRSLMDDLKDLFSGFVD